MIKGGKDCGWEGVEVVGGEGGLEDGEEGVEGDGSDRRSDET